jgi:hypothetical protein
MANETICERCRELYATYKNVNEEPAADVYSAQAELWRELQSHLEESGHNLQSVIADWANLTRNEV